MPQTDMTRRPCALDNIVPCATSYAANTYAALLACTRGGRGVDRHSHCRLIALRRRWRRAPTRRRSPERTRRVLDRPCGRRFAAHGLYLRLAVETTEPRGTGKLALTDGKVSLADARLRHKSQHTR